MNNTLFKIIALWLSFTITSMAIAQEHHIKALDLVIDMPQGFASANHFIGFEQLETFSTVRLSENFKPLALSISEIQKNNPKTTIIEELNISGRKALLMKSQKSISGTPFEQLTLMFGDTISTVLLVASYPPAMASTIQPVLKKSLLSARWLRQTSAQLFHGLPFTVNQSSQLHFIKRTANALVLKDNSPYDRSKSVVPLMVINTSLTETPVTDNAAFATEQLHKAPGLSDITINQAEGFTIAGIKAYRIIAEATDNQSGSAVVVYQAIAYQPDRILLISGLSPKIQAEQFLAQFKQITDSVSFKKK